MTTEALLHEHLIALGEKIEPEYFHPDKTVLETFPLPQQLPRSELSITINATEFTSLCPKTGQPDFAEIEIEYAPDEWCLESKSLKLYLGRYRMFKGFHEAVVTQIGRDLVSVLRPHELRVTGNFTVRGGISFNPTFTYQR